MRVLIVATLLLAACGKDDAPGLRLLHAGTGDKHLLRYSATKDTTYEVVMTIEMDLGTGLELPVTSVTMEIKVTDVTPEGDISYDFRFTDVEVEGTEVPPEPKEMMMSMTGSAVVDSRGVNKAGKFEIGDDAPDAVKQMLSKFEEQLRQMSCPFPQDAVGIGAKWTLTQDIDTAAFMMRQVGTFELVELEGNRGKLRVSLKQSAEDAEMNLAGGARATLLSLDSTGTGELEFDLSKPVPVKFFVDLSSDIHVKVGDQTHRQQISVKVTMKEK